MRVLLSLILLALTSWAQEPSRAPQAFGGGSGIAAESLRRSIEWMVAPERCGRVAGSPGAEMTARWLANRFQEEGVPPGNGGYFFPYEFDSGYEIIPNANALAITSATGNTSVISSGSDLQPLAFTENGVAEGELVFAGYGLSVPDGNGLVRYNSYENLDVTGKVVLLLREEMPPGLDPEQRRRMARYGGLRYRAMIAREHGASGVLFAGETPPLDAHATPGGSGVVVACISETVANRLLASGTHAMREPPQRDTGFQPVLRDRGALIAQAGSLCHVRVAPEAWFAIPGVRVKLTTGVRHSKQPDRDVIAMLPPSGTDEYLVVGAHYDHLGMGRTPGSLMRPGEEGLIHPGADDNASGTALLVELAGELARDRAHRPVFPFQRGIIFACWSGEEIGLLGSAAFVDHPPVEIKKIVACLNFDMVGRLRANTLTLEGVASSDIWRKLVDQHNTAAGFKIEWRDDPYLPTDTASFLPKRIPVLSFFTGIHDDYHRPTDTADKLDYAGIARVGRLAREVLLDLASTPERPRFTRTMRSSPSPVFHETARPSIGIFLDRTSPPVRIAGVRIGSPAAKAGLQRGDVFLRVEDRAINTLEDYTRALERLVVGSPARVAVRRGTAVVDAMVTPAVRE